MRLLNVLFLISFLHLSLCGAVFAEATPPPPEAEKLLGKELTAKDAAALHALRALEFEKRKAFPQAILEYQKALQLDPDNADICSNLATLYVDLNKLADAEKLFKKAIRLAPETFFYHVNLANLYYHRSEYDNAIKEYRIALDLNPESAVTHSNLGDAYLKKSHFNLALRHIQKAIELEPDFAIAHSNLGGYYYAVGERDKARPSFLKALELNPELSAAYEGLGKLEIDENRPEDALKYFNQSLDFATSVYEVEQAKTGIAKAEVLTK